jgi:hypothetical protein
VFCGVSSVLHTSDISSSVLPIKQKSASMLISDIPGTLQTVSLCAIFFNSIYDFSSANPDLLFSSLQIDFSIKNLASSVLPYPSVPTI